MGVTPPQRGTSGSRKSRRHLGARRARRNLDLFGPVRQRVEDHERPVTGRHGVDRSVRVYRRMTFVGRDLVVHERVIRAPVPQRQHDVALLPARSRRRGRNFALRDAPGPVGKRSQRPHLPLIRQHRVHRRAAHAGSEPPLPRFFVRLQFRLRLEDVIDAARELIAKLMAEVAVGLERVDPVILRQHRRPKAVRAVARKLVRGRRLHERQPVVAGIDLRCFLRRARRRGDQRPRRRSRFHLRLRRVDEAVAAHPDAVGGLRQFRQHEASAIVGNDDLRERRRQILRLGDHPHAGLGNAVAAHNTGDVALRRCRAPALLRAQRSHRRRPNQSAQRGAKHQDPHSAIHQSHHAPSPSRIY